MNKTIEAKKLMQALSFGDKQYAKELRTYDNKSLLNILLDRIQTKMLDHSTYWTAVYGVRFAIQTGRIPVQSVWIARLSTDEFLKVIVEVLHCSTVQEVCEYLDSIKIESVSTEWSFEYKRIA